MPEITKMPLVKDEEQGGRDEATGRSGGGGTSGSSSRSSGPSGRSARSQSNELQGAQDIARPGGGSGGSGGTGTGAISNTDRWNKIETILNKSDIGKSALKFKKDKSIAVNYAAGTGSFYSGGAMTLDTNETPEDSALTFVHEMNHAMYDKKGISANVMKLGRAEYVDKMLDEEVQGVIVAIEAKGEIIASGTSVTAIPPLESTYTTAYKSAISAKKNDTAAKADGRAAVKKAFTGGSVTTSNTHESYPVYYGKFWDKCHPKGGGGK